MHVTLVSGEIAGLESEWDALFARDPTATPFSSFQWASAWCEHWGEGALPWVLAAREGQRLVGLMPLALYRRRRLRTLRGLGVGVGNYWDIIAAPPDRDAVAAALAGALQERRSEWDALILDKLPEESGTDAALHAAGLRIGWGARAPSPRIELPATFEEYLGRLSGNRRQKIRRNLRTLDRGELTVGVISDPALLGAAIDRWQTLRIAWWAQRKRSLQSEHASERFLAFTQEAIAALVARQLAVVWEVRSGAEIVGVAVNFLDADTFYYWLWGFDQRIAKLHPGHVLLAYGVRWSIETGRRHFDLMIGDEPYKYEYAPSARAVRSLEVGNRTLGSRAVLGLSRLRHAVRDNQRAAAPPSTGGATSS